MFPRAKILAAPLLGPLRIFTHATPMSIYLSVWPSEWVTTYRSFFLSTEWLIVSPLAPSPFLEASGLLRLATCLSLVLVEGNAMPRIAWHCVSLSRARLSSRDDRSGLPAGLRGPGRAGPGPENLGPQPYGLKRDFNSFI